ncbi:tripartite tricarboxylate transporter substrate binding protein [Roseomonas gilardii subsp. gilardii]|uniref:tripartite tricarboxylate transporter substrate binding protein n=1 Tax=Roseomonas gilardii TaxID=257708 RepID=UPI001FF9FA82|nr:tripartite tricarboxylate transporter substrate binding protein [Roseomonas gilardii]UPG72644.1 tripartite tricarboxylate transporter substrate binding protein [Roseomonas gilardii subsp. gilardii]
MPHPTRRLLGAAALAAFPALALPGRHVLAQGKPATPWPDRPTRIVVPFPPAGSTDILARILADRLGPRLGAPVVVENRAGAAGVIGSEAVARAEPDGTTLLMTTIGTGAINYALYAKTLTFRPQDLAAVSNMAKLPNVIMAPASSPVRTLEEFVAAARKKPGMTFASSGNGTSLHLTGELLKLEAGIDLTHVPYRGAGPMITDVIAGRVDMAVDNLPSSLGHIKDGRLRALAVTSAERSPALPEVPTTAEAGQPGVQALAWFGIQAPARMPRPLVERLSTEIRAVMAEPATIAKVREQGAEPVGDTPEEFETFIASEITRWGEVVRKARVTVD